MSLSPGLPALVFPRARALARLGEVTRARVALLTAEAGAGKSRLLGEFLETVKIPQARLDLRSEHGTFAGFMRGLVEIVAPETAPPPVDTSPGGIAVIAAWCAEHAGVEPRLIIIDELHQLTDAESWKLLSLSVDVTSSRVKWILSGRSTDALPVARWLANGIIDLPIDDEDLRVNVNEAIEAVSQVPMRPSDDELRRLVAVTRGSPLRLSLALTGDHDALTIKRDQVYDRLLGRVLAEISEHDQELVFVAALLGQLSSSLLVQTGHDSTAAGRLRATGFVTENLNGEFTFREPYRSRLLDRFRARPEREAVAHRVALALESHGRAVDALRVLVEYGNDDAIVEALERSGLEFLDRGVHALLQRAFDRIADGNIASKPAALAVKAGLESSRDRFDLAEAYHRLAINAAHENPDLRRGIVYRYARELSRRMRPSDAIAILEPEIDARTPSVWNAPLSATLATAYLAVHRPALALEAARSALSRIDAVADLAMRAQIFQAAAYVAHGTNDFNSAVDLAERSIILAERTSNFDVAARALSIRYHIAFEIKDDPRTALQYLRRLDDAGRRAGNAYFRAYAAAAAYDIAVLGGDLGEVSASSAELRNVEVYFDNFGVGALLPAQALEASWRGRFDHAYRLLEPIADHEVTDERRALRWAETAMFAAAGAMRSESLRSIAASRALLRALPVTPAVNRTRAFLALAHVLLGQNGRARVVLEDLRALSLTPGAEAIVDVVDMLRKRWSDGWYEDEEGRSFEARLELLRTRGFGGIGRFIGALPLPASSSARVLALTDAETAVLRHFAEGATSKEIATALDVSVNTVDGHARSICRKLGCQGRRRAVTIALREGLIRLEKSER